MCLLLALAPPPRINGQATDPRGDFLSALGRFSLALDGTYGDEGQRLSDALDAMAAALTQWDAMIQSRERAMAADIAGADATLAARMHLALGGLYLDRLRAATRPGNWQRHASAIPLDRKFLSSNGSCTHTSQVTGLRPRRR